MQFSQSLQLALAVAGAAVAKDITVTVSDPQGATLKYSSNSITAAVGDTVTFVFNPKNHTVTESSFAAPCVPLASGQGFNSGFMPQAAGAAEQSTFTYTVSDSNPHWFYCAQGKHCESGMVGVINPPAAKPENNADSFAALAKAVNATIPAATVQGGKVGSIKANSAGSGASNATVTGAASSSLTTGAPVATSWTYTSGGQVYTKLTTEVVAGYTQQPYTSVWQYTSGGSVVTTSTVGVQNVPILATALPGAANKAAAGAGVAAAAGVVAALLI